METMDSGDLKVKEKQECASSAEQTRPGLVFTPDVDIFETENDIFLLADMPGVKAAIITMVTHSKMFAIRNGFRAMPGYRRRSRIQRHTFNSPISAVAT